MDKLFAKLIGDRYSARMALAETTPTPGGDEDFVEAVARNIRTLLAMRGMKHQELADAVGHGFSSTKLSQRMGGHSRWLAIELHRIAEALEVDTDVLFAMTEQDFRDALSRSRCSSETGWPRHLQVVPDPEPEPGQTELDLGDR